MYVFRLTSFLLVTSHPRFPPRLQSACSTNNDPRSRLRFTIPTIPFEYSVPSYHALLKICKFRSLCEDHSLSHVPPRPIAENSLILRVKNRTLSNDGGVVTNRHKTEIVFSKRSPVVCDRSMKDQKRYMSHILNRSTGKSCSTMFSFVHFMQFWSIVTYLGLQIASARWLRSEVRRMTRTQAILRLKDAIA